MNLTPPPPSDKVWTHVHELKATLVGQTVLVRTRIHNSRGTGGCGLDHVTCVEGFICHMVVVICYNGVCVYVYCRFLDLSISVHPHTLTTLTLKASHHHSLTPSHPHRQAVLHSAASAVPHCAGSGCHGRRRQQADGPLCF